MSLKSSDGFISEWIDSIVLYWLETCRDRIICLELIRILLSGYKLVLIDYETLDMLTSVRMDFILSG